MSKLGGWQRQASHGAAGPGLQVHRRVPVRALPVSGCVASLLRWSPGATVTKDHTLGALNQQVFLPSHSGGQQPRVEVSGGWFLLEAQTENPSMPLSQPLGVVNTPWGVGTSLQSLPPLPCGLLCISVSTGPPVRPSVLRSAHLPPARAHLNLITGMKTPFPKKVPVTG